MNISSFLVAAPDTKPYAFFWELKMSERLTPIFKRYHYEMAVIGIEVFCANSFNATYIFFGQEVHKYILFVDHHVLHPVLKALTGLHRNLGWSPILEVLQAVVMITVT